MKFFLATILFFFTFSLLIISSRVFLGQAELASFVSSEDLKRISSSICVHLFYGKLEIGSGTLIEKKQGAYLVLTNAHVVRGFEPISIQTPDGKKHKAQVLITPGIEHIDIALLQFDSKNSYQIASWEKNPHIQKGEPVLAAGFAVEKGLIFSTGKISFLPDKILKDGYQIGYTSDIKQGMSGGPILSAVSGKLIAINGKSAFPITNNGYVYEDGSIPSAELIENMRATSWGIPVQNFIGVLVQSPKFK